MVKSGDRADAICTADDSSRAGQIGERAVRSDLADRVLGEIGHVNGSVWR